MLTRVPLVVGVACALAVAAQAAVGWPSGVATSGTSGTDPAPRHTAAAVSDVATLKPSESEGPEAPIAFAAPIGEPPASLATFYGQSIDWKACTDSKRDRCGAVTVPIDYAKPDGETVRLALRKVPALDEGTRKGTLFINPGGPGGSGIEFAQEAPDYFSRDVRRVWDVVGFDPRGIGQSAGFECLRPKDLDALYAADPTPETEGEQAALERAARARLKGCVERGGELALNMSSEHVAKDLDIMRAAVGDTNLNYLGVSYGTLVGALYADLFTDRVGLMVLDSAVAGDGYDDETVTQHQIDIWAWDEANAFDGLFADYVSGCEEREDDCPLGTDPKDAQATLVQFLDRLESRPLRTEIRSLPRLTQGWASAGLRAGLLHEEAWADLDYAIAMALEEDDGSILAYLAMFDVGRDVDGTYTDATFGSNGLPVKCADWPVREFDRITPSPSVFERNPLWALFAADTHNPCDGWPGPYRDTLLVGAEPATPILVIGNTGDQITPIESTEALAGTLIRSRLVTVDADGHGAYAAGNDCADEAVDTYLVDAIPPKYRTECPAD